MQLDLGSLKSIRLFATEFIAKNLPLHYLINNAGIMNTPYTITEDGFEAQFGVNHLGHFLLTNLLLDKLKESAPSKIINLSSSLHEPGRIAFDKLKPEPTEYKGWTAYSQSKMANVLFTYELARKLEGTGVTCNAVHPGFVATDLGRHTSGIAIAHLFARNCDKGAMTTLYAALHPDMKDVTGKYLADTAVKPSHEYSYNEEIQKKLWEVSEKMVELDQKM